MEFSDLCSFYFNVREQHGIEITLKEFVRYICSERWKTQVEEYQRLMAEGDKSKAKVIKNKLPGLIVAGRCKGSHALENLEQTSGDAMFDTDHTDERTMEILHCLQTVGWVKAGWRSVSGQGVKVVVRIEALTQEEYTLAYAIVAWHISSLVHFPCDMSCKNLTRPCFASYDPEAFFKDDAEVFPWRRFAQEHPEQVARILEEMKVKAPATKAADHQADATDVRPAEAVAPWVPASGMMNAFFNHFLSENAFVDGRRNDFLLKLGRAARYRGMDKEELEQLKLLAIEKLAGAECPADDIPPRIESGYHYADKKETAKKEVFGVQKVQGSVLSDSQARNEDESIENEQFIGDKLRREVSCFPDWIFEALPDFILRGLKAARTKRERDILLMSVLTNVSACLPGVRMIYAGVSYSPHFFFAAIAGAGRGKGVLALGSILPDAIQAYFNAQNKKEEAEYDKEMQKWQLEERVAALAKRVPDLSKRPTKPVHHMLKIAPNTSKNQLIIALEESGARGVIMNATELDMISSSVHQDYGRHDDVLRNVFHHEEVSSFFKVDKRLIVAPDPHMALCVSGTPAQLHRFISSLENGMYSRVAFYIGQGKWTWVSVAPDKNRMDTRALFKELSGELLEKFLFLSKSPTEVIFTDNQWEELNKVFSGQLQEVVSEDDDSHGAIVVRHGLIASRIAMTLTALRKCEPAWNIPVYQCTDEDFYIAMEITQVLLEHSLLLSTSLPGSAKEVKPMRAYFRMRPVLDKLPKKFRYTDLINTAVEEGISVSSAKRYLYRLLEMEVVVKEEDTYAKNSRYRLKRR